MIDAPERGDPRPPRNGWLTVALYPCNLLGLLRLGLVVTAVAIPAHDADALTSPGARLGFVGLLATCSLLDPVDGWLARRLGHVTRYGAWLDQGVDLLAATALWSATGALLAGPVLALQWATALVAMGPWAPGRGTLATSPSRFARAYFAREQRNALSTYATVSHVACPAAIVLGPGWSWAAWVFAPGVALFALASCHILRGARGRWRHGGTGSGAGDLR